MKFKKSNEPNSQDPVEGLPDIANDAKLKNISIIIGFVFVLVFILWRFTFSHVENTLDKAGPDETFTLSRKAPELMTAPSPIKPASNAIEQNANQQLAGEKEDKEAQKLLLMRIQAPLMIVGNQNQSNANPAPQNNSSLNDPNTQFLNESSSVEVATLQANILKHRSSLIAQGNFIDATLDTAINSDLPGQIRATINSPIYAEDGSHVLIHPGSRLIGQYKSGLSLGQSRIFVVWTRLIDTHGYSIALGSPGTDSLGMSGMTGEIDRHFWQTFGNAVLLSLIGAGASNIGVHTQDQYNSAAAYRQAISQSLSQSAANSLQQGTIPPTIHINQGENIHVFVAKDLRFDHVKSNVGSSINVFN